jgi:hypothetical protein
MKNDYVEHLKKLKADKEFISHKVVMLEKYEYLYHYFLPLVKMKNPYLTAMRTILAFRMFKDGMIQNDIAIILSRDHSSVNHIFGKQVLEDGIYYEVLENLDKWIADRVYPSTVGVYVPKKEQKHSTDKWKLIYKLKPI